MHQDIEYIVTTQPSPLDFEQNINNLFLKKVSPYKILILNNNKHKNNTHNVIAYSENGQEYYKLTKHYPSTQYSLQIQRNITSERQLIANMYYIIIGMIVIGFIFIIFFATILSQKLLHPLEELTSRFTNMNESMLEPLSIKDIPSEFAKLGESINFLITKIKTFINYRKELYIGTAHELKTPLAVMRLKNQITLMKYKKQDKIRETLQQNIDSIDTLNAMIHNILEYGRAEGAQFQKPERINLIRLMATKSEEYELLAQSKNRNFLYHFNVPHFIINLQPLLFMQIFQNFIQNALRFTPEGGLVSLQTRMDIDHFIIEIIDEGPGIDLDKDLFAPFQRSQDSTGAGLGLFLAQNAAESMGITINLKNREKESGCIASIHFPLNRFLLKD